MPPKLLIAIPTTQGICKSAALVSLARVMGDARAMGMQTQFMQIDGSEIATARNHFASLALADAAASHLLFIDSDMLIGVGALRELVMHNKPLIGAIYRQKTQNPAFVVRDAKPTPTGLFKVGGIGMGFTLIAKDVLRAFASKALLTDAGRYKRGFFDPLVVDGATLSEDYAFCERWRQCGGDVWGVATDKVGHVGDIIYTGVYGQ